jgi:hypothetical protein
MNAANAINQRLLHMDEQISDRPAVLGSGEKLP